MSPAPPTDLRHLGDFSVSRRMLVITAFALPIGALSAGVTWALLRLIGLITNLVFYQRFGTALVAVRLEQLLEGRLRDLDEERHRSRVLRPLELIGAARAPRTTGEA